MVRYSIRAAKTGKVAQIEIAMPEFRPAARLKVKVKVEDMKMSELTIDPMR